MATLINGDGNPAVYAIQDADFYTALLGGQTRILNRGLKFAYHIENINTFLIDDGLILTKEGRRIQLDSPAQDEITIPNGVQGSTQYYIVGYHLYTDASANQLCEVFIQQMDNATDTIEEKTFIEGETEVYISLYRITQTELVVSNVQLLLPVDTTQAQDRASLALSLSDLRASFMGADTALSNRITANTNNIANIRGIISAVEEGNTATAAYSSGDFVQYTTGGTTYFAKAVSPIAIGDMFVNGTNVENTTIADNLGATDRTPLTPPTATGSYTYDGTEKSVVWSGLDTSKVEIQGTQSAVNAGTYTCEAVLKDSYNYCWTDGTNAPKTLTWTIAKQSGLLLLSANTDSGWKFTTTGTETVAKITQKSTGTITATISPASMGSVSISGNNIVYTPTAPSTQYSGTITINDSGDTNTESDSDTITLTNIAVVKKVTWANGTDAEVKAMVDALDAGAPVSLTGWSIGDERTVSLIASGNISSQSIKLVLMDNNQNYELVTPTSGKTKSSFVVGQKDTLHETIGMNSTATNSGSWDACAARIWCNGSYRDAFPSTMKSCFKQFKVITAASYNGSQNLTSNDYFAFFAEKEILGTQTNSNATEASALTQIEYYKTAANRIKKDGYSGSTDIEYWQRSPYRADARYFCTTSATGTASMQQAQLTKSCAPFGVI